jgi:uncharacterized protein (DUF433 family)
VTAPSGLAQQWTRSVAFQESRRMSNRLIQSHPNIMMGKPVVVGTRITVELILEKLAAGESIDQLLAAYPRLTRPAVLAALEFAAQALKADAVYPIVEPAA